MANNVTLPLTGAGSSATIFGTVEKASAVHVQRVSAEWYQSTGALSSSAAISSTSSGLVNLVAGSTGQSVRILGMFFSVGGAVDVSFFDGASSGTALVPAMSFTSGSPPFTLGLGPEPWFVAASSGGFSAFKSAGVQMSGRIYYTKS